MLPRDLVRRIRRIEIGTRRAVNAGLAGQYHSVFKGMGMVFSEVRQYQPGDEIRTIDWNVTARLQAPYVKVFTEERELTVMLLVDLSASGDFGSTERSKAEVIAEVSALLAFSAIKNNDRVGLLIFTDRVERFIPPKKGRRHVLRVISEILAFEPVGRGTSISLALDFHLKLMKRTAVTFLVSDFLDDGWEKPVGLCGRRHDLVPIVICDPLEESLPRLGIVCAKDAETGSPIHVDTSSERVRRAYEAAARRRREAREKVMRREGLDWIEVRTDADYVRPLVRFFKARARRRGA